MADKVQMVAKKDHTFKGTSYRKGDPMSVTQRESKWLLALRRAVIGVEHTPAPTPADPPAPVEEMTRPKRAYKRKDIAPTETSVITAEPKDEQPQYRSRFTWPTGPASVDDDEPSA